MTSKQYEAVCESLVDTVIHLSQLAQKDIASKEDLDTLVRLAVILMSCNQ